MDAIIPIIYEYLEADKMTLETQMCLATMGYHYFSKLLEHFGEINPYERYQLYTVYSCDISNPLMTELFSIDNTDPDERQEPIMSIDEQGLMIKLPMPSTVAEVLKVTPGRYVTFPVNFLIEKTDPKTESLEKEHQRNVSGHIGIMLFDRYTKQAELIDPNGTTEYFSSYMDESVKKASIIPLSDLIDYYVIEYINKVNIEYRLVPQKTRNYNLNRNYTVKESYTGNCKIITLLLYCIFSRTECSVDDILKSLYELSDDELYNIISRFASWSMLQAHINFGEEQYFQDFIAKVVQKINDNNYIKN